MSQKAVLSRPARSTKRSSQTVKSTQGKLHSWKQVSRRLAALGETERQIRSLNDQFRQKVALLKQEWLEASHPIMRDNEKIKSQIERFYFAHRDEVLSSGRSSVCLEFGRLGSRRVRRIVVLDASAAVTWFRDNGFRRYLRTRTVLDRAALRSTLIRANGAASTSDVGDLVRCPNIRLQETEEFWYQVDEIPIVRALQPATRYQPGSALFVTGANPQPIQTDLGGEMSALDLCAAAASHLT